MNLADLLRRRLTSEFGYQPPPAKTIGIKNSKQVIYHLVHATKNELGNEIWDSINEIAPGGQRGLPL